MRGGCGAAVPSPAAAAASPSASAPAVIFTGRWGGGSRHPGALGAGGTSANVTSRENKGPARGVLRPAPRPPGGGWAPVPRPFSRPCGKHPGGRRKRGARRPRDQDGAPVC